jgi:hypothetical protein
MSVKNIVVCAAFCCAAALCHASVLTFDGNICSLDASGIGAFQSCNSNAYINQGYGDTARVNVTYEDLTNSTSLSFWGSGYGDLTNVAYGGVSDAISWGRIEIAPLVGQSITLNSFDLAAFATGMTSNVRVLDLSTGVLQDYGTVSISDSTHNTFSPGLTSFNGFAIEWKNSAYDVGIDNINFTDNTNSTNVPEPGSWWLPASGACTMAWLARRRRLTASR